ncbi:MAG: hypothetical protein ACTSRZ_05020 [Promethearchaeota archaeon]
MLKITECPHCGKLVKFSICKEDIDHSGRYPAPIFIQHREPYCGKWITVYFDSKMRVTNAFKNKEERAYKWNFVKEICSIN